MAQSLRLSVLAHCGLENEYDDLQVSYLRLQGVLLQPAGRYAQDDEIEVQFRFPWAEYLSALQPDDFLAIRHAFETQTADGRDVWEVGRGSVMVRVARNPLGMLQLDEAACSRRDLVPVHWFRLPTFRDRPPYTYRKLASLHDRASANVLAVMWENAKPGVVLNLHSGQERVCMNLLVVDKSMTCVPSRDWEQHPLLPQCSLQVRKHRGPGAVRSMPFLCVGAVVRAHRVLLLRKYPRFCNLWSRKYSAVATCDLGDAEEVPEESACTLLPIEDQQRTETDEDRQSVRDLHRWIRQKLTQETLSAYLRRLSELPSGEESDDVIVEVLAVQSERKEFLVTDWTPGTRAVRVRAAEPDLSSVWLFANLQRGHWVKLRHVKPLAEEDARPAGDAAQALGVLASLVTRVPTWCFDVVERCRSRSEQRLSDFASDIASFEAPAARSVHGREPNSSDPRVLPAPEGRPAAAEEALSAPRVLNPNRRARMTSEYGTAEDAEALPLSAALDSEAESNLLLCGFVVRGICGTHSTDFAVSPSVEDLLFVVCVACGHRQLARSGILPGADSEGPAASRRRVELSCGHSFWNWRFEGSLKIAAEESSDELVVAFSEEGNQLFGVSARDAAQSHDARQSVQVVLASLFQWQPGERAGHSLAVVRRGSGSGGGDVDGRWILQGTRIQLC